MKQIKCIQTVRVEDNLLRRYAGPLSLKVVHALLPYFLKFVYAAIGIHCNLSFRTYFSYCAALMTDIIV